MNGPRTVLCLEEVNERLEARMETLRDQKEPGSDEVLELCRDLQEHLRRHEELLATTPREQREREPLESYVQRSTRTAGYLRRLFDEIERERRSIGTVQLRKLQGYAVDYLRRAESVLYPLLAAEDCRS